MWKSVRIILEPNAKQVYAGRKGEDPCIQSGVHRTWKLDRHGNYIFVPWPNIFGALALKLFHVVLFVPRNLRRLQHFGKKIR
jgi:hypothetical protein